MPPAWSARALPPRRSPRSGTQDVCLVITGEWVDRDGDEDIACADYIEALLSGQAAEPAHYAQRVRGSDFGRRFGAAAWPNLSLADLETVRRRRPLRLRNAGRPRAANIW
jgi:hypothetical protein